ncbi:MAG TPA: LAGLIDADG family homing endonuclease [Acidimicrobiales bacterium]|jgi:ribonucleotide reductase alpha subunit|nr:LAGLIDADG family homing endonuclease [Acidimicrobiales bacterium]
MAMAPERIGIGIHRHFTSPGMDPFDTVLWERRDARISNYLTGAVAFEQLGVEVPAGWSVNATNILAQKYFRGTLGTPEREWSLKQVTRRVVDTITEWGRKDGYFVDDDEAEAFRDELAYLIIHQRAAFNSPVWFNIGVKGVPQQASACQPYDALVCTDGGLRAIGELVETGAVGTKVFDAHGLTQIVAVKANGRKPVLRLHTRAGIRLDVTPDHLVWQARGQGSGSFVPAGSLQVGDQLSWHSTETWGAQTFVAGQDNLAQFGPVERLAIERIEPLGEMDVFDIQTDSGEYLSSNLRVHNCFILSVEDSMSSILNWYVEEGTIFKGGSGSGINLSRIRSSKEGLRGGGTASGPVSFMRGADASAGTIKCLDAETPIVTTDGVRPIREVAAGTFVPTRFGLRRVTMRHDNGVRPLVRVRTDLGESLVCTPEHRLWVRSAVGEGWREAAQLEPGDAVLLDTSGLDAGRLQPLATPPAGHFNEIRWDLPSRLDQSLALWLGWLTGDGSVTRGRSANFIAMQLGDEDGELVSRYTSLVQSLFGPVNVFVDRHRDRPDASASVRFCSTRVIKFLELNGLLKDRAHLVRVPDLIASSPNPVRAAFLAGLFEADGHVGNGYVWLSTVSEELVEGTQRLLHSLGIPSWRGRIDDRQGAYGSRPIHTVRVIGSEGMRRFAKLVGFVSERKTARLQAAVERRDGSPYETQWALPHAAAELDELWVRGDGPLRRALAPYCRYAAPRQLSLLRARALMDHFGAQLRGTVIERFADGDEYWTTVTVEPAGDGPTCDLTVEGVHEYLVHNLVTHNSGGKTRRAAKMVILNADHPDIEDFIWCKAIEERKARALRDAGFDMDLDGKDSHSIQYQNANNSVRVTDEFMEAVLADADWELKAVTTGEVLQTVKARALFRQISKAAWECADPGMQFDTTINRWHTAPVTGRINGSNPCFPGDALVHTDKGLIAFKELFARANEGEHFAVYTHDDTNPDAPVRRVELTTPEALMITGVNEIVRLTFDNGMQIRCTPKHRVFTTNRGWVEAQDLTPEDQVKTLDVPAPPVGADLTLPVSTDAAAYRQTGDHRRPIELPEKWSAELAHYLGWLIGDGSATNDQTLAAVYGSAEDQAFVLPCHSELVTGINGGITPKPSVQGNGTLQQRLTRRQIVAFFRALGLNPVKGPSKSVPWSVFQAPQEIVAAFLQGLFDADGCVRRDDAKGSYVGLGSSSCQLLVDVQRLLTTFGIDCTVWKGRSEGSSHFRYQRKQDGPTVNYQSSGSFDLRITASSIPAFARYIGFSIPRKSEALERMIAERTRGFYTTNRAAHLVDRVEDGYETTYNLCEPRNHSYIVNGIVVRNCSEYMHLDNSACNLASLNLLSFLGDDDTFDVEGFKAATEVIFTAQEILVGNADYPTDAIAETSRRFRQLGIGYANLGALLMSLGLPYDSEEGRAWASAITALLTGMSYATSGRTAARMGPFAGYTENRDAMLKVLRMHRDEVAVIDEELVPTELLGAAQEAWDAAVEIGEQYGVRNSQASVLAPTGTIALLMDCDTTGIEPDLGLVKTKKLVGGGTMSIVNQTVPRALRRLGYSDAQVSAIVTYIDEHKSIVGAPGLKSEHLPVFACSMGDNTIHYRGHVQMMGAVQPFISGAISKCVTGDTLVSTAEGLVRIGNLYRGEEPDSFRSDVREVASLTGPQKTDAFYYGGLRPVISAALRSGHRVTGTANHRLLVSSGRDGLEWRRLDEVAVGEYVATQYGDDLWSVLPARLDEWTTHGSAAAEAPEGAHFRRDREPEGLSSVTGAADAVGRAFEGSHRGGVATLAPPARRPAEMSTELAFLLGAYAAGGRVSAASWGVTVATDVADVCRRLVDAIRSVFDVPASTREADGRAVGVEFHSQVAVELFEDLGCGQCAVHKRIPDAVLRSPRSMVLAYLEGLFLAADVTMCGVAKWAISCESPGLLDDLQAVLTNLGVVHERATRYRKDSGRPYDEVFAVGDHAYRLLTMVPFLDPHKAAYAQALRGLGRDTNRNSADVVPGISPYELYRMVPRSLRSDFSYLSDPRAMCVSRRSLEHVAAVARHRLPQWLRTVLDDNLHFSPVDSVASGGVQEVFDLSVPTTQAFVGNGIVNHNTVNMPEEATVEDVEQLHIEAWQLGLKAVAIYRDNCKVAQPLATTKKAVVDPETSPAEAHDAELALKVAELERALQHQTTVVVKQPIRERLPRKRRSMTFKFRVADCEGYVTVGEYDDGRPGEVFMQVSKQGSTLAGIMDAFAVAVSLGLQHGVPLATFVRKYTNMRFEPAGMTDDRELRIASSLVDYIFRRLAVDYLSYEERAELGILTTDERLQPTLPGVEEVTTPSSSIVEEMSDDDIPQRSRGGTPESRGPRGRGAAAPEPPRVTPTARPVDAPYCYQCGVQMQRSGSCFACPSCGSTSGCS